MEIKNVDNIILLALLEASRQDDIWDRDLGPIHIVKYVYLADLTYAQYHNGETYSKVTWKFHHYGPWALDVYKRIDDLADEIGITKNVISSSRYKDDFVRYSYSDDYEYNRLTNDLPLDIIGALKQSIRKYSKNTPELLNYVYKTRPMLCAAPGENLDFSTVVKQPASSNDELSDTPEKLTVKRKRLKKEAIEALKRKIAMKHAEMKNKHKEWKNFTPPRYDEVYFQGVDWVESLAGDPLEPEEGTLEIPDEFWKSPFRCDDEIS